jgi:hypothetical protein
MTDPETYEEWLARTEPNPDSRQRHQAKRSAQGIVVIGILALVLLDSPGPIWVTALAGVVGATVVRDVLLYRGASVTDTRIVALSTLLLAAALVAVLVLVPWPFNLLAVIALLILEWFSQPSVLRQVLGQRRLAH